MIGTAAAEIADAIALAMEHHGVGEVNVYPYEPETAAAPCVWLTFLESGYVSGVGRLNTFEATVVADAALNPLDAQALLYRLTDAVLDLKCDGVVAVDLVARGGGLTTRMGDVPHPVVLVTIPQVDGSC